MKSRRQGSAWFDSSCPDYVQLSTGHPFPTVTCLSKLAWHLRSGSRRQAASHWAPPARPHQGADLVKVPSEPKANEADERPFPFCDSSELSTPPEAASANQQLRKPSSKALHAITTPLRRPTLHYAEEVSTGKATFPTRHLARKSPHPGSLSQGPSTALWQRMTMNCQQDNVVTRPEPL